MIPEEIKKKRDELCREELNHWDFHTDTWEPSKTDFDNGFDAGWYEAMEMVGPYLNNRAYCEVLERGKGPCDHCELKERLGI